MLILADNSCKRFSHIFATICRESSLTYLNHIWFYNSISMLACDCRHWISYVLWLSLTTVIALNDKRLRIIQDKLLQPSCNPLHSLWCKRSHCPDTILLFDFLRCVEYTRTRQTEIKLCIGSYIRLKQSGLNFFTVCRCMCRLWPHDWCSVTSCDHKKSLAHSRCTIICCHQFFKLHLVSQILKLLYKLSECVTLLALDWMVPSIKWSPCLKFLNILKHDHSWSHKCCPSQSYPCQPSDVLILWFTAFGLGEVLAVRREPGKSYRMSLTGFHRIHRPYILAVVPCIRMIDFMYPDSLRIMVDGYINAVPCRHLYSC